MSVGEGIHVAQTRLELYVFEDDIELLLFMILSKGWDCKNATMFMW